MTPQGGAPKHPYPLSAHQYYTTKAGGLHVVDCINTIPNADYRIGVDNYTMTKILNTSNFARMKENFYYVHVPLSQLDRSIHQMLMQRTESVSALEFENLQAVVFPLGDVVREAIQMSGVPLKDDLQYLYHDMHGFNIGAGAIRLLDMLGYGSYVDLCEAYMAGTLPYTAVEQICETITVKPSVYRLLAYQKVWHSFFRNDVYDEISPRCFNCDDVTYGSNVNYDIVASRGNVAQFIRDCCRLRYVQHKKDFLTACMPGTQFGAVSVVGLKSDITFDFNGVTGSSSWRYKSAIDVSEKNAVFNGYGSGDGRVYDLSSSVGGSVTHDHLLNGSASLPSGSSLFDVLQLVESQALQKWKQKSMLAGNKIKDQYRAHHGVVPKDLFDYTPDFIGSVDNVIDVSTITAMSDTANEDGTSNLGQIAGRGRGNSDKRMFKFHSDTYGILLVLRSIVPENTYSSFGLDLENTEIFYSDFFQTEFQNLGLRPVPSYAIDTFNQPQGYGGSLTPPSGAADGGDINEALDNLPSTVVGYAPPYFYKKQRLSKVHGLFNPARLGITYRVHDSIVSGSPYEWLQFGSQFGYDDMRSFVSVLTDYASKIDVEMYREAFSDDTNAFTYNGFTIDKFIREKSSLYISPSMVDSLFAFNADDSQLTDEFLHWTYVMCDVHAPMTPLGLPQF